MYTKVQGYRTEGRRITGVELADGTVLDADLVIDVSGRNFETPLHLSALGFGSPLVSELQVDIGYSTTLFTPPAGPRDWKGMLIHSKPPATRTAALLPTEGRDSRGRGTQIATGLFLTENTVKVHVKRILRKLGAANRTEAAALYHRLTRRGPCD